MDFLLDPNVWIAFAMLTALVVVTLLYVLIQIVCIGTLPELANSERPLTDASSRFLGAGGASVISAGALLSMTGTLSVIMLSGPRVLFAMAEQGQFPSVLSVTHRRFHTPYVAILLTAGIMLVVTISGTFIYALTINMIIRLVNYAATCAALPVLRRRSDRAATFRAPAGTVISIVSVALCAWLLSSSGWREARDAGIAAALGLILYVGYRLWQRAHGPGEAIDSDVQPG